MDKFTLGVILVLYILNGFAIWVLTIQSRIKKGYMLPVSAMKSWQKEDIKKTMLAYTLFWPIVILWLMFKTLSTNFALSIYNKIYRKVLKNG